jgi:hypothetical protein
MIFNRFIFIYGYIDIERAIARVGFSGPILMGVHDATMIRYIKQDNQPGLHLSIPQLIIIGYKTDLQYQSSLRFQNAHQTYSV